MRKMKRTRRKMRRTLVRVRTKALTLCLSLEKSQNQIGNPA